MLPAPDRDHEVVAQDDVLIPSDGLEPQFGLEVRAPRPTLDVEPSPAELSRPMADVRMGAQRRPPRRLETPSAFARLSLASRSVRDPPG